ncbi:hypothetical protein PHYBLDRAFT_143924 [Phycomyces blakesleeanus NRRL 1555(-)]|uniref:MULE transposase domain-containing protein n=1 Tax=Phycomyces blakesleeanus (strain ATCC 8743b / DSM 1359 / FGSC 10004 / NBRC 33097 / NRRL 1555) TaxID=763407 RepID=A0A162PZ81_PHYB8|nr:hypothetical protein PHYBLDRAFT_143924 [Phycomyces blakesleeanus NRRL 1555(-)]OAD75676.1 hypothetical protein PHYBLDRAFT_143924 [Phycomyces blakesleeanus NRRL 1555(-)]|eukprot:XP_018293716.1 hypothetical protein PHYBLDRAFT_143924 [Phycomyces blakesleeanus NRRL 1555(-)]
MSISNTQSNETIYTLATISQVLECSSVPEVMTLRLENIIRVKTSEWKECLTEIGKACAVKWVICNTNKQPTNITAEEAKATDYAEHTPGDMRSDICTLPLAKKYLHELAQQLKQSSKSASQIRIDMLRAINKKLYHFDKDQMTSFLIWMNNKLSALNFNIFKANTSYSLDPSAFAYGFMSPIQQEKMKTATSFCLDVTHAISSNVNEILYTLLMRDEDIGRVWPVAFIVTNDRGVSPIVQCLQFLKRSSLLVDPKQFTIDCCAAEVHAIQTTFLATSIQFCIFHETQAWNQKLSDSVKTPGSLPSEARILRGVMIKSLQEIIYEEDIDEFHHKIRNWCTEAKFKIWSRAYHEQQFSHMLTNNYIKSWHNQLKTVFMKRSRNKRLDKLVFVLLHDVEYYLTQEYERVMSNNDPMSSFTRQQRIHEMGAEEVNDDDREMMIVAPGTAEDVAEPNLIISCICFDYQRRYKPSSLDL